MCTFELINTHPDLSANLTVVRSTAKSARSVDLSLFCLYRTICDPWNKGVYLILQSKAQQEKSRIKSGFFIVKCYFIGSLCSADGE